MTDDQTKQFTLTALRVKRREQWKRMMRRNMPDLMRDVAEGKIKLSFLEIDGKINGIFESPQGITTWSETAVSNQPR